MQDQSVFGAAGDTGGFACIRSDGTTIPNVLDPPSQPWVTGVGGTSFDQFNPGENARPSYPKAGPETVWNVDNLCNSSASEGMQTGFLLVRGDWRGRRRNQPVLGAAVLPDRR